MWTLEVGWLGQHSGMLSGSTLMSCARGRCSLSEVAYALCARRPEQMRVQLLMQKWFSSRLHAEPLLLQLKA